MVISWDLIKDYLLELNGIQEGHGDFKGFDEDVFSGISLWIPLVI